MRLWPLLLGACACCWLQWRQQQQPRAQVGAALSLTRRPSAVAWTTTPHRRTGRRPRVARGFAPLSSATEGSELLAKLRGSETLRNFGFTAPGGPLDLGLPDPSDMDEIVELVHESFDRLFAKQRFDEGFFGFLVGPINSFRNSSDKDTIRKGLEYRVDSGMQFPSLARPAGQDTTVAILARGRPDGQKKGPLIGYFELCLLPADGRRPEDDRPPARGDAPLMPYFSNLCVAEPYRRGGLGRSMLNLAEEIVVRTWGDEKVYLHIDDYEASRRLYTSAGYGNCQTWPDGVKHMCKELDELVAEEAARAERQEAEEEAAKAAKEAEEEKDGEESQDEALLALAEADAPEEENVDEQEDEELEDDEDEGNEEEDEETKKAKAEARNKEFGQRYGDNWLPDAPRR